MTYPHAEVVGFDVAENFPSSVKVPNVKFMVASATERFPFDDNTISVANIR